MDLKPWVQVSRLDLGRLIKNPASMPFVIKTLNEVSWNDLEYFNQSRWVYNHIVRHIAEIRWGDSWNEPCVKNLFDQNLTSVQWFKMCASKDLGCLNIIMMYWDHPLVKGKIDWFGLSKNPKAVFILEQNLDRINWDGLSQNENAIHLLKQNLDKIDWSGLSYNQSAEAMVLLEDNLDKIDWIKLAGNPYACYLFEKYLSMLTVDYLLASEHYKDISRESNSFEHTLWFRLSRNTGKGIASALSQYPDKINWIGLTANHNLEVLPLLEQNLDKIDWSGIAANPNAIHLVEQNLDKISWSALAANTNPEAMELIKKNMDKADWIGLAMNPAAVGIFLDNLDKLPMMTPKLWEDPKLIDQFEQNVDYINWVGISGNPGIYSTSSVWSWLGMKPVW
jgi:hypothetical protein